MYHYCPVKKISKTASYYNINVYKENLKNRFENETT